MEKSVPEQAKMPVEGRNIKSKSELCFPVWPSLRPQTEPAMGPRKPQDGRKTVRK